MKVQLAKYATKDKLNNKETRRQFKEKDSSNRTQFQRDRDRIIHSKCFRKLFHKTQVLPISEGDLYHTRLIHSMEVGQIARSLANALKLNQDLTEAIALAHDLGHPPFGHDGEKAINAALKGRGKFDHNLHAFKLVTKIEKQDFAYDGLNLTWAMLEGLIKHNGPIKEFDQSHEYLLEFNKDFNLELDKYSSLEAQCAAIADDIAYNSHDIDDAVKFGAVDIKQLEQLEIPARILENLQKEYPDYKSKPLSLTAKYISRKQISLMIEDVIAQSKNNLKKFRDKNSKHIRNAGRTLIEFSDTMKKQEQEIKKFLYDNFYFSPQLAEKRQNITPLIDKLFNAYYENMKLIPKITAIEEEKLKNNESYKIEYITDFIAGMTDNYAQQQYEKINAKR